MEDEIIDRLMNNPEINPQLTAEEEIIEEKKEKRRKKWGCFFSIAGLISFMITGRKF